MKTMYYRNANGPVLINEDDWSEEMGPKMSDDEVAEWNGSERISDAQRAANGGEDADVIVADPSKVEVAGGTYTAPEVTPPATPPSEPPIDPNKAPAPSAPIGAGAPPPPPPPATDTTAGETIPAPASQIAQGSVTKKGVIKDGRKYFIVNVTTGEKLSEHGYTSEQLALDDLPNIGN